MPGPPGASKLTHLSCRQVGPKGSVLGIDCLPTATRLARRNLRSLARDSPAFAERAAPCAFATHNCFMPAANFAVRQPHPTAGHEGNAVLAMLCGELVSIAGRR